MLVPTVRAVVLLLGRITLRPDWTVSTGFHDTNPLGVADLIFIMLSDLLCTLEVSDPADCYNFCLCMAQRKWLHWLRDHVMFWAWAAKSPLRRGCPSKEECLRVDFSSHRRANCTRNRHMFKVVSIYNHQLSKPSQLLP